MPTFFVGSRLLIIDGEDIKKISKKCYSALSTQQQIVELFAIIITTIIIQNIQ